MTIQGMGRRVRKTGAEQDIYSPWRKYLIWASRPGATKYVKRMTHKRERREWRDGGE